VRRKKSVRDELARLYEHKGPAEIYFKFLPLQFTGAGGDDNKEKSQDTKPPGLESEEVFTKMQIYWI
jgi:hypothetical protein